MCARLGAKRNAQRVCGFSLRLVCLRWTCHEGSRLGLKATLRKPRGSLAGRTCEIEIFTAHQLAHAARTVSEKQPPSISGG
jgi:hypothetical protein